MSLRTKRRRKFRPSPDRFGRPPPTKVAVVIHLRNDTLDPNPSFYEDLKTEFEATNPRFEYKFLTGEEENYDWTEYARNVIVISDDVDVWVELYVAAKVDEPRRIGGSIAQGGEELNDAKRKFLEEATGGRLPLFLSSSADNPYDIIAETLAQTESILIWQNVSLETRWRQDKKAMRKRLEKERRNYRSKQMVTVWIRVGWREHFDLKKMKDQYGEEVKAYDFVDGEDLPPRKDLRHGDAILLVSTCPKKLSEMYDLVKEEWEARDIDLALLACNLPKREKKELESHLNGHLPFFYESIDLHFGMFRALRHFENCTNYQRLTKAWYKAKIDAKRARLQEEWEYGGRDPLDTESEPDSTISCDTEAELSSDYELGNSSDDEDLETEGHDCANCVTAAEANGILRDAFIAVTEDDSEIGTEEMIAMITSTPNWLRGIFNKKQETLTAEYRREKRKPPNEEAKKRIQKKARAHAEVVLRKVIGRYSDEEVKKSMVRLGKLKFHASLHEFGRPKVSLVAVFVHLRKETLEQYPLLDEELIRKTAEYNAINPRFNYFFCIVKYCDESKVCYWSEYTKNVLIISDDVGVWMKLYKTAKREEPRRVGGAIAMGGEMLSDELRNSLEDDTGGHLPLVLSAPPGNPYEMITETLAQTEPILIWQRVSLAARRRQDKRSMRKQFREQREMNWEKRKVTVWIRVGWREDFDAGKMMEKYTEEFEIRTPCHFVESEEPPLREDLINQDAILVVSTCPQKLLEMYDQIKDEWGPRDVDLALVRCELVKTEKNELESRLDGHLPHYNSGYELHRAICKAISHFDECENYKRMTKVWIRARIKEKRSREHEKKANEDEDNDSVSLISFDSVDEPRNNGKSVYSSEDDEEDSDDTSEHEERNCVAETDTDSAVKEVFINMFGPSDEDIACMRTRIANVDNWLLKVFDWKLKILVEHYMAQKGIQPAFEARKEILKEVSEFTETVLRGVMHWEDDSKVRSVMDSLLSYILNVQSLTRVDQLLSPTCNSPEGRFDLEGEGVASEGHGTGEAKRGIKGKASTHSEQAVKKVWNGARIEEKPCREPEKKANEDEDSDSDSLISFDSVDELPSDYESNDEKESGDVSEGEASDIEMHDSTNGDRLDGNSDAYMSESSYEDSSIVSSEDGSVPMRKKTRISSEEEENECNTNGSKRRHCSYNGDKKHGCTNCVSTEKADAMLKEAFMSVTRCCRNDFDNATMVSEIIGTHNWLNKLFDHKKEWLLEEHREDRARVIMADEFYDEDEIDVGPSDQVKKEIEKKAVAFVEVVLRKVIGRDEDQKVKETIDGLLNLRNILKTSSGDRKRRFRAAPYIRSRPTFVEVWVNVSEEMLASLEASSTERWKRESYLQSHYGYGEKFRYDFSIGPQLPQDKIKQSGYNVLLIASDPETWLDMYRMAKEIDCRKIGGAVILGGQELPNEIRELLETETGGRLPLLSAAKEFHSAMEETISQIENVLIEQRVCLATRRRANKSILREQLENQEPDNPKRTVWIRLAFKDKFYPDTMTSRYLNTRFCVGSRCDYIDSDNLPAKHLLKHRDAITLVSNCPKMLELMYHRIKGEWKRREIGFALVRCELSKKEKIDLESRLDGHLPYYRPEDGLSEAIYDGISHLKNRRSYRGMTKAWNKARLAEKRARVLEEATNKGGESDSDSAVSFTSVDYIPSDYERQEGRESSVEREDSDGEVHDCTNCVSEDEVNEMLRETYIAFTGLAHNVTAERMKSVIIWKHNWLHRIFHCKQEALLAEYSKDNNQPPTVEAKKEIKKKASWHTEILLRKFSGYGNDATIRGHMEGLHKEILKVESGETEPYFPDHPVHNNVSGNSSTKWSRRRYY